MLSTNVTSKCNQWLFFLPFYHYLGFQKHWKQTECCGKVGKMDFDAVVWIWFSFIGTSTKACA